MQDLIIAPVDGMTSVEEYDRILSHHFECLRVNDADALVSPPDFVKAFSRSQAHSAYNRNDSVKRARIHYESALQSALMAYGPDHRIVSEIRRVVEKLAVE